VKLATQWLRIRGVHPTSSWCGLFSTSARSFLYVCVIYRQRQYVTHCLFNDCWYLRSSGMLRRTDCLLFTNVSRVTYRMYLQGSSNPRRLMLHNLLLFIIEMKSVYSAVRTGSLNKAVCASSLKGYPLNVDRLIVPKHSVNNYRSALCSILEEERSHSHSDRSRKSRLLTCVCAAT